MTFERITEQSGNYRHLEKMSIGDLLTAINSEDRKVAEAVKLAIPQIEKLVEAASECMLSGGRIFYLGAGTSGRLGILDASEIPPSYGMPQGFVIGIIAGGESAIQMPIENAEDNTTQGWLDLQQHKVNDKDIVIGIAASGTTPYVISALQTCRQQQITTACITCNTGSPLAAESDFPVEVVVGPEIVTGSTRMKSGTAQKLVLNMISTSVMIQIGRVEDNKMVNMQLTNQKLIERGIKMILEKTSLTDSEKARELLLRFGSIKKAIDFILAQ